MSVSVFCCLTMQLLLVSPSACPSVGAPFRVYVHPGTKEAFYAFEIGGFAARNRAMHGDTVIATFAPRTLTESLCCSLMRQQQQGSASCGEEPDQPAAANAAAPAEARATAEGNAAPEQATAEPPTEPAAAPTARATAAASTKAAVARDHRPAEAAAVGGRRRQSLRSKHARGERSSSEEHQQQQVDAALVQRPNCRVIWIETRGQETQDILALVQPQQHAEALREFVKQQQQNQRHQQQQQQRQSGVSCTEEKWGTVKAQPR